jgi:uncharacterized SAM-binding protein YcdF (DUF218 family)
MFFILSKLLAFVLSPFLIFYSLMVGNFVVRGEFWKKRFLKLAFAFLIFFSLPIPIKILMTYWETPGKQLNRVEKYEIGVVLSGMVEYNNDVQRLSARRGADRIWQALNLYKKGRIKKILISGGSGYVIKKGLDEANQLKETLILWGVPEEDIISESESKNTYENALFTAKILKEMKYNKRFLLITSAMHMKRAAACFSKQNLHFDVFTTDHYIERNATFTFDQMLPSVHAFVNWEVFLKEFTGYYVYKLQGYL